MENRAASVTLPALGNQYLSLREMYDISSRVGSTWGIKEYKVPVKYIDIRQIVKDREYASQKKGQKLNKKAPNKGSYLDDISKITQKFPGVGKYNVSVAWGKVKPGKVYKKSEIPNKDSYIDQIFKYAKRNKIPGVGAYNVIKPEKEVKAQIAEMQKKEKFKKDKRKGEQKESYLNEYEYLGNATPGPGNYQAKLLKGYSSQGNKLKPADWVKKHKETDVKAKKSQKNPAVGLYNPMFVEFQTFDKLLALADKKKKEGGDKSKMKSKYWGTEERFKDPRKSKSKSMILTPGVGQYPLIAHWSGKDEGKKKEEKKKNWMKSISKGNEISIYYEDVSKLSI